MLFGLKSTDIEEAQSIIKKTRLYPENNFLSIHNRKIPFADFSDQLLVNPEKFMRVFTDRLNAFQEYANKRGLCEITIILTAKDNNLEIKEMVKYLYDAVDRLKHRVAWKKIKKDLKLYISTVEPHDSGKPHLNVVFWLPEENAEEFIEDLLSKFKTPQIYIMSSFIPGSFNCKERVNQKTERLESVCTKDGHEGFVVKADTSMLDYATKNIRKIAKQLQRKKDEVSELLAWYLVNNITYFRMSQTLGPMSVYKHVNKIFSLLNFTELWTSGDIQVWKQNNSLDKITQGEVLLWEKSEKLSYSSSYKGKKINKNSVSPYSINFENPETEILCSGSLKTIVQQNGMQKFEITLSENGENLDYSSDEYEKVVDLVNSNTEKLEKRIRTIQDMQLAMQQSMEKIFEEQKKVLKEIQQQNEKTDLVTDDIEYIGTKELAKKFDIKIGSQKNLRGRVNNPLPYHQDMENGKISYYVPNIREWKYKQKVK
jgi:hypothetical protein